MSTPKKVDLVIVQGSTFQKTVMWETAPRVWKPITNISQAGPAVITAVAHGVPDGWRVGVVNVKGMLDLNAKHNPPQDQDLQIATKVGVDSISLNEVSSADFDAYISGGYLVYWTPHDLTGYTARMKIKDKIGGTVLDTVAMTLDPAAFTIDMLVDAVTSAAFTWLKGVYDLELVSPGAVVTAILTGSVKVQREVTT